MTTGLTEHNGVLRKAIQCDPAHHLKANGVTMIVNVITTKYYIQMTQERKRE